MKKNTKLKVSIVMGSQSDYKIMKLAEKTLKKIGVLFETKIISAHRTPKRMYEYALSAEKKNKSTIIEHKNVIEALIDSVFSIEEISTFIQYQPSNL